jgi:hypothetical protein
MTRSEKKNNKKLSNKKPATSPYEYKKKHFAVYI